MCYNKNITKALGALSEKIDYQIGIYNIFPKTELLQRVIICKQGIFPK